jgi:hypothetical protein
MGMMMPETCSAVSKRQALNLCDWCVCLVDLFPLYLYVMHWLKAVYCMVQKHGDSQKMIRDGSKLQRWMSWGDLREHQEKKEFYNVTIRQQIGLEETIVKGNEQNQLTPFGNSVEKINEGLSEIPIEWKFCKHCFLLLTSPSDFKNILEIYSSRKQPMCLFVLAVINRFSQTFVSFSVGQ